MWSCCIAFNKNVDSEKKIIFSIAECDIIVTTTTTTTTTAMDLPGQRMFSYVNSINERLLRVRCDVVKKIKNKMVFLLHFLAGAYFIIFIIIIIISDDVLELVTSAHHPDTISLSASSRQLALIRPNRFFGVLSYVLLSHITSSHHHIIIIIIIITHQKIKNNNSATATTTTTPN
jgi:hypothetical protein